MIIIIAMDEEKLIEAVRTYPCIWHVSSKSYEDIIAKSERKCLEGSRAPGTFVNFYFVLSEEAGDTLLAAGV